MLLSRITLGDEIKTFLCGDIILLVEDFNLKTFILYHYFQVLQGSVGEGGGGLESVGDGVCSPALYMSYCTSLLRN